jgi:hypothetical protein
MEFHCRRSSANFRFYIHLYEWKISKQDTNKMYIVFIEDLIDIAISHAKQCFSTKIMLFEFKYKWFKIFNGSCWNNVNPRNTCRTISKKHLQHSKLASSLGMSFQLFVIPTLLSYIEH